jgi:DHA3 family multidrug efflux protein-like MFS transporter
VSAAPITSFLIAPIAEFWLIPYMEYDAGRRTWGWLLGDGAGRGIALVFLFAGIIMIVIGALAFATRSYRILSAEYAVAPTTPEGDAGAGAGAGAGTGAGTISPASAAQVRGGSADQSGS